ncbi:MAG: RnfABCDGE type electron transport complex subunit B [Candidatus Marinimicrobia bacterium]|jgi:electron transport complex protein RnfB|nr:RnfABCDGE type electron transport complex subunit B [Candidatus Neomarinimicrobiota bacterium]MCK9483489.1 RnfABCDGE type electron transport complex subunit B [Candidatus Neomarinimicrobiota bacterium]MCK9559002.1 RnfABCDGE type electron transport complex subunit B [Candidatus Neomarinimicrobiota bacterium]MDD5061292.1 RnfABCDGE type electron transport complex subunit B [Candidatus Neomarinimicrobiota bacterium]MDD5230584.1 RnfABCDGE type electron transport complex subunit B [Candidatus Neom
MNSTSFLYSLLSMGGIGLFFALLIALANKKLHVEEDPKIGLIAECLPGANCGSCGYAGCNNFAEALAGGKSQVSGCPVCSPSAREEIARILGVNVETGERRVAVVFCQGGDGIATKKAEYSGIKTCFAANLVGGGERACSYGCIGLGDCVAACPFDAIHMNEKNLPVVDRAKCTGCGNCVTACPRGVIELHPISHHVFVLCKNRDSGKVARSVCKHACIGCLLCEKAVNGQGFKVSDNLASVDHAVYTKELVLPTEKCPTKAIVVIGTKDEK